TYDHNGETIPSNVQCVYSSMGDGTKRYNKLLHETTVPSLIACGQKDEFNAYGYYHSMVDAYDKMGVTTLQMDMPDLGHEYPYGIDPVLKYDRYTATLDFFDYHLKGNIGAKAVYAYPKDDNQEIALSDSVYVKFNTSIEKSEIVNNVKVVDAASGRALNGSWTSKMGNTEWTFTTDEFENAHVYNLIVPTTIKGDNGLNLSEGWFTKFITKGGEKFPISKDAYISNASLVNTGSENTIEIATGTKKGYLEFDLSSLKSGGITSSLQFNVENNAKQTLLIYGLKENAPSWEEGTINWDNAPANIEGNLLDEEYATLVSEVTVIGSGIYNADVTSYIDSLTDNKARFVISSKLTPGTKALDVQFDNLTSAGRNTASSVSVNECFSDKYIFRTGGAPSGVTLSSEYDVNGNGKSLFIDRANSYDRIKFYNTFKTSALTQEDLGRAFEASVWVYPLGDITLSLGLMNLVGSYSSDFYSPATGATTQTFLTKGSWQEVKFSCIINQNMIDQQIGLLTLQATGTTDLYIDNVAVKEVATDVTITSKEGNDTASKKFKPVLLIEKGDKKSTNLNEATYIENGDKKDTIFNGGTKLYVNGIQTPTIADGNKKAYIKIPVTNATNSKKTEFVLDVKEEANNLIYVYGLDGGRENIATSSSYPLSSVHAWKENTLTWYNAPANNKTDNGILSNFVYNGKEISKVFVNGSGRYTVDITDYAKKIKNDGYEYATIILVAQRQNETPGLIENFDSMVDAEFTKDTNSAAYCHSDKYFFRTGGAPGTISLTDEEDANGDGKSISVTRTHSYDRIKFYNTFKTTALTEDDIGRTFNLSFKVKTAKDTTIIAAIMNGSGLNGYAYGGKGYGTIKRQSVTKNTWTTISFDYTLDATNVAGQIGLLSIEDTAGASMFIDDIKVYEKNVSDVVLNSKENTATTEKLGYSTTLSKETANGANAASSVTEYSSLYYYRTGGSAPSSKNNWTNAQDHTGD
ncbi:MAG: DNRLRE domain-containing protein, partial [Clostridia bacterium]|nr:DNRLRE domain-containing protein [Clostridia bacterium]